MCLHGYQRNTVDLDLVIRSDDSAKVRPLLEDAGLAWVPNAKEFRTDTGIAVPCLISGENAGGEGEMKQLPKDRADLREAEFLYRERL